MSERTVVNSMSQKQVLSLGPQASVTDAAALMTRANTSSVLVMELPNTLLGIVTERDLVTRVIAKGLQPAQTRVADIMTRNPMCVKPEMLVSDAVLIMIEKGFRHLPVVGPGAKIVGVFSVRDALPREIDNALSLAEFKEQVNDALG